MCFCSSCCYSHQRVKTFLASFQLKQISVHTRHELMKMNSLLLSYLQFIIEKVAKNAFATSTATIEIHALNWLTWSGCWELSSEQTRKEIIFLSLCLWLLFRLLPCVVDCGCILADLPSRVTAFEVVPETLQMFKLNNQTHTTSSCWGSACHCFSRASARYASLNTPKFILHTFRSIYSLLSIKIICSSYDIIGIMSKSMAVWVAEFLEAGVEELLKDRLASPVIFVF